MSFQISVSDTKSEINLEYNEGIKLNGPYEMCLKSFVTYNNIPNITEKNNIIIFINVKLTEVNGKMVVAEGTIPSQHIINLPTGTYELNEIFKLITENPKIKNSNTVMRLNKNTFTVEIESEWYIDFTSPNSIGRTLGFSSNIFSPNKKNISDLPVQLFTINTIKIKCNLIKCNIDNLKRNDNTLYEFPLKCESGEKIIERPISLCYYPINNDQIYQLHLRVVDQDDNLISFRGEKITITLGFQPCV